MSMNTTATVTIKPHPREVVREFLEACKNYGSAKFYNDVIAEIEEQVPDIKGIGINKSPLSILRSQTLINPNRSN